MLKDDGLSAVGAVRHGFFTREGGVSTGIYDSLNCGPGSDDAPGNVAENRARAMARLSLPANALATAHQVHGCDVFVVDGAPPETRPRVDALVTRTPGVALGILTADCAPVLFADEAACVIGAAHAGWRGALAGVIDATVAAMEGLGASRGTIRAAVGPCIAQASYEVGPGFPAPFLEQDAANAGFFAVPEGAFHTVREGSDRPHFDLDGYVVSRLERLGLASVGALGTDTCPADAPFFSYRRSCHRGEPDYGRELSAIVLKP